MRTSIVNGVWSDENHDYERSRKLDIVHASLLLLRVEIDCAALSVNGSKDGFSDDVI